MVSCTKMEGDYMTFSAIKDAMRSLRQLVALCGKLIRVLHTLGTKQRPYDANDVLGPIRQAQLQMAA